MSAVNFIAIIPARFESSRLPGKPLADINGKSMIRRVWEQCGLAPSCSRIVVATDDPRIEKHAREFGAEVVMTSSAHNSGTDRIAEAARKIKADDEAIVINVQGDEPFLDPFHLEQLSASFQERDVQIATLAIALNNQEKLFNPNTPKVAFDQQQNALYFSRHPIPFVQEKPPHLWLEEYKFFKHIGIYAFRMSVLQHVCQLPVTAHEQAEKLEQLRWLDHGLPIHIELTTTDTVTVDTPDDLELARKRK